MSSGTGGHGTIQHDLRVIAYPDKPGIARIYAGEVLLFDAEDEQVTDVTVRAAIPFHSHFENATYAVAFRMTDNETDS